MIIIKSTETKYCIEEKTGLLVTMLYVSKFIFDTHILTQVNLSFKYSSERGAELITIQVLVIEADDLQQQMPR